MPPIPSLSVDHVSSETNTIQEELRSSGTQTTINKNMTPINTINPDRYPGWTSNETTDTDTESETQQTQTTKQIEKTKEISTSNLEGANFKTCLTMLMKHITQYLYNMKDILFVLLLFISYQLLGNVGFWLTISTFTILKSIEYSQVDPKHQHIHKISNKDQASKDTYKNLKVPEKNKIKLKNKIKQFQKRRKPKHLQFDETDSEGELVEEKVYLPDYPPQKGKPIKFLIDGQVEDVNVTFEVDSGSPITLISTNVWDNIENNDKIKPIEFEDSFVDFNGHSVEVVGRYNLNLRFGKFVYMNHDIYVVKHKDSTKKHALVGADLIRAKRLGFDHKDKHSKVYLSFRVNNHKKLLEFNSPLNCYVTNTIEVDPGKTEKLTLSVLKSVNKITLSNPYDVINAHGMVQCQQEEGFMIPQESIASLDNRACFQIPVTNTSYGPLLLFEGQKLGEFKALEPNTLLQTTYNTVELINTKHKSNPDPANTFLQYKRTLKPDQKQNVNFLNTKFNDHMNIIKFILDEPDGSRDEVAKPTFKQINKSTFKITGLSAKNPTNRQFWLKVFNRIKKRFPKIDHFLIDYSPLQPTAANLLQILHRNSKLEDKKLTLSHKNLSINKIKLMDEILTETSDFTEDDMAESLFPKIRIEESKQVWENLLGSCPKHLQNRVFHLLTTKFPNVVSKHSVDFGKCTLPDSKFKIELNTEERFTAKPYPLNSCYQAFVQETIDEMVAEGFLIEESSEYGSGVFVRARPSADGNHRIRLVYDLRRLNSVTKKNLYPIPSIKNLLQKLKNKKHWCLVDLKDSYQSIELAEETRHLASIVVANGQYTPSRMGYGFTNAPSHFSRVIARTIAGIKDVFNYLDDLLILADTPEELVDNFEKVLNRLDKAGFRISLGKVCMFKKHMRLLGVLCSPQGISPDPGKVAAIQNIPAPTTKTQVQQFIGALNYQSDFIRGFAHICEPLLEYVKTDTPKKFQLSPAAMNAFQKLKDACSAETLLYFIDGSLPVFLDVDASQTAYGGICYQIKTYSKDDIPELQKLQEEMTEKTPNEINEELQKVIDAYVFKEDLPPYDFQTNPINDEAIKKHNPNINIATKTRLTKDKVYMVHPCFFISKKFTASQALSWSSLMKEISAIVNTIEKRADILALGLYTVVASDCSAAVYLWSQATSHSLMSRYLARLSSYPFKILVRHKPGRYMNIADGLSRFWTIEEQIDQSSKVTHLAGILVRSVFPVGTVVTPEMIVTAIQEAENPLVMSAESPLITKGCQTDPPESWPAKILDPNNLNPDLPVNNFVNNISSSTQTGTRENVPNREKGPRVDDRKGITILNLKKTIHDELNKLLSPDNFIIAQMTEFYDLYISLVKLENNPGFQLSNGLIMTKRNKIWVRYTPPSLTNHIIARYHMLGHFSSPKLIKLISATDWWPKMAEDVRKFTNTCLSCLFLRGPNGPHQALGVPLAARSCDIFQLDTVSGLPTVRNKSYFCSLIDTFSRFVFTFPLSKDRASETANHLVHRVFSVVGPPRYLVTDGASNLNKSEAFQELCATYNIIPKIRSPYSSRSLGMCERVHLTIQNAIRSLVDNFQISWLEALPIATSVYNQLPHSALNNYSPYEVFFGRAIPLLRHNSKPDSAPGNYNEVVNEHKQQIKNVRDVVERLDKQYKEKMRNKFGGKFKEFKVGQFILVQNKVPTPNIRRKLKHKYIGPLLVHFVNDFTLIVENIFTGKVTTVHKDLAKVLPERDHKYDNIIHLAKIKCGSGFTYEEWQDLWAKGKLSELFHRSVKDLQSYGDEGPIANQCDIGEVELHPEEEPPPSLPARLDGRDPASDSTTDDEPPPPHDTPPIPGGDNEIISQEIISLPPNTTRTEKQVRFNIPEPSKPTNSTSDPNVRTSSRSGRQIKAPSKLDL